MEYGVGHCECGLCAVCGHCGLCAVCAVLCCAVCSLSVPCLFLVSTGFGFSDMEGDRKKKVSWKGEETAGAGGANAILVYQVEEGNTTRKKVEDIKMKMEERKLKREEEKRRLQKIQEQQDKLEEWKKTLPEKKQIVTDDKFLFEVPGVRSQNYFPLWLDKEQEENIERAKEKDRHTFESPNLLFIGTKGRFVHYQKYQK